MVGKAGGERFPEGLDAAFGVSVPEDGIGAWETQAEGLRAVLAPALPPEGFSTVELPFSAVGRRGLVPTRDLCIRLGAEFSDPGGSRKAFDAAATECRALRGQGSARVAAFLLEFPPSFSYGPLERRHLDRVVRALEDLPLALAFFDPSWYSLRVIEALKERKISLCLTDLASPVSRAPGCVSGGATGGPASPPRFDMATSSLVYIKFYGFGLSRGDSGDLGSRLCAWVPRMEALALQAETLRVIFQAGGP